MAHPRRRPTEAELARFEELVDQGVGYQRAANIAGANPNLAKRWKARGEHDIDRGIDSPEARFARAVHKLHAGWYDQAAHILSHQLKMVASEDTTLDRNGVPIPADVNVAPAKDRVGAAQWILARLDREQWGEPKASEAKSKLAEQLLEELQDNISESAFAEVYEYLSREYGVDAPEPPAERVLVDGD